MPNNVEDLTANFQADVTDTANTHNINTILKMDETFVKLDNPPSYTLNAVCVCGQYQDIEDEYKDGFHSKAGFMID